MPGCSGDNNPVPGKFIVQLNGRWPVTIELVITLRVRGTKEACWLYLNKYSHLGEIGELIASVTGGILQQRVLQIKADLDRAKSLARRNEPKQETRQAKKFLAHVNAEQDAAEEAQDVVDQFVAFMVCIPEIAGDIIMFLQELGRSRLAGLLVVSVTFSSVQPSEEFQEMLRNLDKANVDRDRERFIGEAIVDRLDTVREFVKSMCDGQDDPAYVLELERLFTLREVSTGPTGLDNLVRAFTLKQLQESVSKPKGETDGRSENRGEKKEKAAG